MRVLPELAERRVLTRPDAELDDDTVPAARDLTQRDLLTMRMGVVRSTPMSASLGSHHADVPSPRPSRRGPARWGVIARKHHAEAQAPAARGREKELRADAVCRGELVHAHRFEHTARGEEARLEERALERQHVRRRRDEARGARAERRRAAPVAVEVVVHVEALTSTVKRPWLAAGT